MEFCKVINNKNIILIGIHWNTGIKNKQRISQFMKSLKKLVNEDKKILIFGDANANPDIRYENCVEKNEEFLNNCIFEWFMNDLGLIEVCPADKTVRTTRYNTRIDRVFTNMANVTIEIETSFLNISDHAALKIEFEEN